MYMQIANQDIAHVPIFAESVRQKLSPLYPRLRIVSSVETRGDDPAWRTELMQLWI
jgi:hypothetical protein